MEKKFPAEFKRQWLIQQQCWLTRFWANTSFFQFHVLEQFRKYEIILLQIEALFDRLPKQQIQSIGHVISARTLHCKSPRSHPTPATPILWETRLWNHPLNRSPLAGNRRDQTLGLASIAQWFSVWSGWSLIQKSPSKSHLSISLSCVDPQASTDACDAENHA